MSYIRMSDRIQQRKEHARQIQAIRELPADQITKLFDSGALDDIIGSHQKTYQPEDPEQVTRSELKHMTHQQILDAADRGALNHLFEGKTK